MPPQLDPDRIHQLARMHVQGFFYLITYREAECQGGFYPGAEVFRSDWGNPTLVGFADFTRDWPIRVRGIAAEGYFKIMIRRDKAEVDLWAFALEWNRSFRIAGFFGDMAVAQAYFDRLPQSEWRRFDSRTHFRHEVPHDPAADTLFDT